MAYDLEHKLVVGISSRALFDLSQENEIFEKEGVTAYADYQKEHETELLKPGPGFGLVKALLNLNKLPGREGCVEVIIMSRNSPQTSLRVFHSIRHYELPITRSFLVSGASLVPYLKAMKTDLFLSAHEDDVQSALDCGIAAGRICSDGIGNYSWEQAIEQIRIAFDGDAVLFSDVSERIFKEQGLRAFEENEEKNARQPLPAGPFARFLKTLSGIQQEFTGEQVPIRTALVTARSAPAHERVIRTLGTWNVRIDEAFFLGGIEKKSILEAFGAHIFFDDQQIHTQKAAEAVPSAWVPCRYE